MIRLLSKIPLEEGDIFSQGDSLFCSTAVLGPVQLKKKMASCCFILNCLCFALGTLSNAWAE